MWKKCLITGFLLVLVLTGLFAGGEAEQRIKDDLLVELPHEQADTSAVSGGTSEKGMTTVSVTGNADFFHERSSAFYGRSDGRSFFDSEFPKAVPPGTEQVPGTVTTEPAAPYYRWGPSVRAGALVLINSVPPAVGLIGAGVDWSPIPHLGLGFRMGVIPHGIIGISLDFEAEAHYLFQADGLKGFYTGGVVAYHFGPLGGGFRFQPKLGYKFVFFKGFSLDAGIGYSISPSGFHGPEAAISSGWSF